MDILLITAINTELNHAIRYKPDVGDYWQAPSETFRLGTGDCEDYAIAKYYRLLQIGLSPDDMAIVYTLDHGGHMVLRVGGVVLDNLTDSVYSARLVSVVYEFSGQLVTFRGVSYPAAGRLPQWVAILSEFPIPNTPDHDRDVALRPRTIRYRGRHYW
mgnify:CR=1 FL=1